MGHDGYRRNDAEGELTDRCPEQVQRADEQREALAGVPELIPGEARRQEQQGNLDGHPSARVHAVGPRR